MYDVQCIDLPNGFGTLSLPTYIFDVGESLGNTSPKNKVQLWTSRKNAKEKANSSRISNVLMISRGHEISI